MQPRDRDYLRAKRVKHGRSRLDPVYDPFVERFRDRYGFSPLAVILDAPDRPRGQGKTPRLGVVLERTSQYRSFLRSPFGFDKEKQKSVAMLFTESLQGADLRAMFGLEHRAPGAELEADEIFVYFDDFERSPSGKCTTWLPAPSAKPSRPAWALQIAIVLLCPLQ